MNNKKAQSSSPTVYPADILTVPDNNDADTVYIDQHDGSGPYALYLSLPAESARLFKECEQPVVIDCSVFQMRAGFLVAFIVLQAETSQACVVVPVCDHESRTWLEQCITHSNVICFLSALGTGRYRRFDGRLSFSDVNQVLAEIQRPSIASAQEVLLAIVSSLPAMSEPGTVPSYIPGTIVDQVNVCVVRDFFNTDECIEAMKKLRSPRWQDS